MRRQLEKADGTKLIDLISKLGPATIRQELRESPGFGMQIDRKDVEISAIEGRPGHYSVRSSDASIEADLTVEVDSSYSAELKTIVQRVAITNVGKVASAPITRIDAFSVPMEVRVKDRIRALTIGGGTTHGMYPTPAYKEEQVTFGKPLQWEDPKPSFTRWWVARRFYRVESGKESMSAVEKWPVMVTGWDGTDGLHGVWAAMEWSGRYQIELACDQEWRFYLRGGPKVNKMVLEPGETVRLPAVHIGVYGGPDATIEDGANSVRRQLLEVIAPDVQGKRPWAFVGYHHWFGIEEHINESIAKKQIDTAAELGVEFFEVDSSWYGMTPGGKFYEGIGNWERVDKEKFPNGLEAVAEYAKSKGMGFGLWFEPERVRDDSDWAKKYPDFFMRPKGESRYLHYDMTNPAAQDTLIEMLSTWIAKLDIRWLRWDYNYDNGPDDWWDPADPTGKIQFAYFQGLYRVWDVLLERHPNLMIDNCASGGRRSDFGTSMRSGTMVISDHGEDPHICRIMQTGAARFIPANWANSSIYCNDVDPDEYVDHLALTSRMAGAISLSGWISHWSPEQKKMVKAYLDAYKSYRHLLMKDFHRLSPFPRTPDDWDVVEFVDPESREAVLLAYRVEGAGRMSAKPVRLDPRSTYRIVDPFASARKLGPSGPAGYLSHHHNTAAIGATLMREGLSLELGPHDSVMLHLLPEK